MAVGIAGKVGLAALIMTASVFVSRVLGVLRESAIAALEGATVAVDAYKWSFMVPEILNHLLASGFLSITFIPIVARYLARGDPDGAWRVASTLLVRFGLLLVGLIAVAMALAPRLVSLLAPGNSDPLFHLMAVRMMRILLPAQLFFFIGGICMAVQFARERFLMPALAPLIYNLGIILGGVLLSSRLGVEGFAWGALGGALIGNFLLQIHGAVRAGMRYRPLLAWRHEDVKRYILLTLPLMAGLTMTFSTEIFAKFFGSFLPAGGIAQIDFAWRIVLVLVALFGQAVGVAAYPYLARLAAENRIAELNQLLNNTLRYLALVIPVSVLVFVLRHEIVRVLFERGAFMPDDTRATALALSGMLVGAAAFTAQTVVNRGFYAMQNTLLPAVYGSVAIIAGLPLYWIGLTTLGVLGVGLAISFSAIAQVVVLYAVWNRRSRNVGSRAVYVFYGKSLLMALPLAGVLWPARRLLLQWIDATTMFGSLGLIAILGLLFLLLMASATWVLGIEEARRLWSKTTGQAAQWIGQGNAAGNSNPKATRGKPL